VLARGGTREYQAKQTTRLVLVPAPEVSRMERMKETTVAPSFETRCSMTFFTGPISVAEGPLAPEWKPDGSSKADVEKKPLGSES